MNYLANKYQSISFTVLLLLTVVVFSGSENTWGDVLLWALLLVYAHIVVGAIYQVRAMLRRNSSKELSHFVFWSVSTILLTFFIWLVDLTPLLFIFSLLFFIVHGALNEVTFLQQNTKWNVDAPTVFMLVMFVCVVPLLLSLSHPMALPIPATDGYFYPPIFIEGSEKTLVEAVLLNPTIHTWFAFSMLLLLIGTIIRSGLKAIIQKSALIISGFAVCYLVLMLWIAPPNYSLVIFAVLVPHCAAWFFLYNRRFREQDTIAWRNYLLYHIYILTPLFLIIVGARYMGEPRMGDIFATVFDQGVYLGVTLFHLTTSLINEKWYRRWFTLP